MTVSIGCEKGKGNSESWSWPGRHTKALRLHTNSSQGHSTSRMDSNKNKTKYKVKWTQTKHEPCPHHKTPNVPPLPANEWVLLLCPLQLWPHFSLPSLQVRWIKILKHRTAHFLTVSKPDQTIFPTPSVPWYAQSPSCCNKQFSPTCSRKPRGGPGDLGRVGNDRCHDISCNYRPLDMQKP